MDAQRPLSPSARAVFLKKKGLFSLLLGSTLRGKNLRKAIKLLLEVVVVWLLLETLSTLMGMLSSTRRGTPDLCALDGEGHWSIGIFKGKSPLELLPIEQYTPRSDSLSSWPVANPVFTCAKVTDVPSSFVADPFIWFFPGRPKMVYLFYETKSLHNMQGDIGAAVSTDGGLSFEHLGIVLDEPHHLSYPFVFEDMGQMYMMPEGSNSGELRLYKADNFPTEWSLDKVLIDQPLIDASLIVHNGKYWIFTSNRRVKSSKNCRELEVWFSNTLKGTWFPHPMNPIKARVQGARNGGRPIKYNGNIYRFGQDCGLTYGHELRAFHVTTLNTTHYEEVETIEEGVPFSYRGTSKQGRNVAWNGIRAHHLDAHMLPNGEWIGFMDGDRVVSDWLTWDWVARLRISIPISIIIALLLRLVRKMGGLANIFYSIKTWCLSLPGGGCCWMLPLFSRLGSMSDKPLAEKERSFTGGGLKVDAVEKLLGNFPDGGPPVLKRRYLFGWNGWQLLATALLILSAMYFIPLLFGSYFKLKLLNFTMWYIQQYGGSSLPVAVDGEYSKFTVVVMSFEARKVTLSTFIQHYSRCASVSDIVIVWNNGVPPDVNGFDSAVPVRLREEAQNSMNNRFKPDPLIHNRGVLMLDDDIMMPCSDVERGFAKWRRHPERITGYYPRLLEGNPAQYRCSQCEKYTYDSGAYNVVLAGAAFMDQEMVFKLYSSPENKKGRDIVDRVMNCDDLLLNFLMADHLKSAQHAEFVRATQRYDVGKLTAKRLSGGTTFGNVRHTCNLEFGKMFDNPLRNKTYPIDWDGFGPPFCGPPWIGCAYVG